MLSFYNDSSIKEKYLNQLKAHSAADEIIQGKYWEEGKGCAVGCLVHTGLNPHEKCEELFNVSQAIWRFKDTIFEGLPNKIAKDFPVKFFESIPVGVDTSLVFYKFMHWLLIDKEEGVINFAKTDESRKVIADICNLFLREINGENIEERTWDAAVNAALDDGDRTTARPDYILVASYAARAAYYAASVRAASHATTARDANDSARAAHTAVRASSAYTIQSIKQSEKLIELMKELGEQHA